jgi:hypothetical protein
LTNTIIIEGNKIKADYIPLYFDYVYETTVEITGNELVSNYDECVYMYKLEDSVVTIAGNEMTSYDDACIYAEYFYESVVNISENDLSGEWGFWVDYIESSGVTVDGNSIESAYEAVGFNEAYDNSSFTVTNNDMYSFVFLLCHPERSEGSPKHGCRLAKT